MKKTALTVLAFAATVLAACVSRAADIYDILPCDEWGMESYSKGDLPLHPADDPNKRLRPGDRFYFMFRFLAKFDTESSSYMSGNWDFYSDNTSWWSIGSTNLVYQPQVGVMVSRLGGTSQLRYADFEGTIPNGQYTDVIFSYELKAGDFALPVVLAMEDASGKPVRASDDTSCALSYFQNPYMKAHWKLRFPKPGKSQPSDWYEADWSRISALPGPPSPVKEQWNDVSLKESGFYAKTVDFSSTWLTNRTEAATLGVKAVWRQVHQGSTTAEGGVVQLEADAAPQATVTLYAWSTNEAAVVVAPATAVSGGVVNDTAFKQLGGLVVTMPDPNATGYPRPTKTYHVWPVVINQGKTESETFSLYGVSQTAGDGWSEIVLSPYTQFNLSDAVNDILTDYETVPVQCTEPLPPNVTVTASRDTVEVGPDQTTPAFELTVALSDSAFPSLSTKVIVTPKLRGDGWPAGADWRDYVHISDSKSQTTDWEYDGTVTNAFKRGQALVKTVYVYALGADAQTAKLTGGLSFEVSVEPTGYFEKLGSATVHLEPLAPVVTAGDKAVETVAGAERTFDLKVSDNYKNRIDTNTFYKVYYRQDDAAPEEIVAADGYKWALAADGTVCLCDTNTMKMTKTLPGHRFPVTGTYAMKFFVEAPNGEQSVITEDSTVTVTVKEAARMQAWFQMVVDGTNSWAETATYKEGLVDEDGGYNADGNPINVKVVLSTPNASLNSVYAFLAPIDATTVDSVSTNSASVLTNAVGALGMEILSGESESDAGSFFITDGTSAGTALKFEVVLTDNKEWGKGTVLSSYKSKTSRIVSENVKPSLAYVKMDGAAKFSTNEGTIPTKVPVGVSKRFTVHLTEIGKVDRSKMKIVWSIDEANGSHDGNDDVSPVPEWDVDAKGDFAFTHLFTSKGQAHVSLEYQDKDMGTTMKTFEFYVDVTDQPSLVLDTNGEEVVEETDQGKPSTFPITLKFSDNGSTLPPLSLETITARVTVVAYDKKETDERKRGFLELGGADVTLSEGVTNEYLALFYSGKATAKLFVSKADGTQLSEYSGFEVSAEVLNDSTNAVSNTPWKDYYLKTSVPVYVKNRAPSVKYISPADQSTSTNTIPTDIGKAMEIKLAFDDVPADLTNGYTVVLTGTELTEVTTNHYDSSNYVYSVKWTQPGKKNVTVTVYDKDETPMTVLNWIYEVAPAKVLITMPHGPTDGIGADYSANYAGAAGLGEGYLFAKDVAFAAATRHKMTWKCGKTAYSATVYASGYKTNAVDNGTLDRGRNSATIEKYAYDIPVDAIGDNATEGGTGALGSNYEYTGRLGDLQYDSFLYAWIVRTVGESEASETLTIAPERSLNAMPNKLVNLPTQAAEGTSGSSEVFDETFVEAVFAREWHPGDNMGDINQDGVPDLYVTTFKLVGTDEEGAETTDDLLDVNDNYVDMLPMSDLYPFAEWLGKSTEELAALDGLAPFRPLRKIRGYGDGLNDATAARLPNGDGTYTANPCAVAGVQPDRVYTNPKVDPYSTLSYVEWLAWSEFATAKWGEDGVTNTANFASWSPERPTNPTKADTDGDGIPDGYEYHFWYLAHVGWVENEGTAAERHRRLTGRRYDPRNPGEGTFISSEEIAKAVDPLTASVSKTVDTDNDGLPDLIELYYLGTNPFDFDSDGDGLPDGFELALTSNLDPTDPSSLADGKSDTERNYDGDAMAISSYALEKNETPVPLNYEHAKRVTFAVIDPNGDTDGVQWYAMTAAPELVAATNAATVWAFEADGTNFVSTVKPVLTVGGALAKTLAKGVAFVSTKPEMVVTNWTEEVTDPEPGEIVHEVTNYVAAALYPVRLEAGTPISNLDENPIDQEVLAVAADIDAKDANACWIYGKGAANALKGEVAETAADYGCLAIARNRAVKKGAVVCALPSDKRDVAFLHYLCYQEFGFDPRTAWKAKDPLATRWSKSIDGQAVEGITQLKQGGYAGKPSRTRDYAAYDEFLVYSFFVNNGCKMTGFTSVAEDATAMIRTWGAFTTNPQGPNEAVKKTSATGTSAEGETDADAEVKNYARGTNGADTDGDGVPDGWELYVMAGPKKEGQFVFANPYAGFATALSGGVEMPESYFSPFLDFAKGTETSNQIYLGGESNDDTLNEFKEFEGTDSIDYYAVQPADTLGADGNAQEALSTTIKHSDTWTWINKFFPTDPWNVDTDGDGVKDNAEQGAFAYGTPADDGTHWNVPGGGLNPNSVDTDRDGLPDGWELQFKGSTPYTEAIAMKDKSGAALIDFAKDADGNAIGNALQGLTDGMDGTVADAYSYPITFESKGTTDGTNNYVTTYMIMDGFAQVVNRDYDRDGLENWQEYLTGTMRCWRWDDPYSPWTPIPDEMYWKTDAKGNRTWKPDYAALAAAYGTSVADKGEFWYKTLKDKTSPIYNPFLVTGTSAGGQYFSRVTNVWDAAYIDATLDSKRVAAYYWFKDRIGDTKITDLWLPPNGPAVALDGMNASPSKYASCSPIDADSDRDGMDDYYELFHGMNPLLGKKDGGMTTDDGPWDLVADSWGEKGPVAWAEADTEKANYWQLNPWKLPRGNGYDFEVFPWLNGIADADPDGDVLPNQSEALLPKIADVACHTDPTPLWMTDTSCADSLTRRFFRLPARFADVTPGGETFAYGESTNRFDACDGWVPQEGMTPAHFGAFLPDAWQLAADGKMNWIFSFEENEGYDTDHDGLADMDEKDGLFVSATDPQDADSPRRRQAMYFQGPEKPSALQTMPFEREEYPTSEIYPDDLSFTHFTVECWAKPESLADATLVERAVWNGVENPGDVEYMRKNFQVGLRSGRWFAKFDPVGTGKGDVSVVASNVAQTVGWTHLALTYDCRNLILYVNGVEAARAASSVTPSIDSSVLTVTEEQAFGFARKVELKAIIVGASAKTQAEGAPDGLALDVTQAKGWSRYTRFFRGWIDEVRVWDGARTSSAIFADVQGRVRYTAALAAENRSSFYSDWKAGKRRYEKGEAPVPELRYHWSFDAILGAENETALANVPHGFDGARATLSRPDGYSVTWWKTVLDGYAGGAYSDPSYVNWIGNTVTHLPRFDGTTLDSVYWSTDYEGFDAKENAYANTAEPVSKWTQMYRHNVSTANAKLSYFTTGTRHWLANTTDSASVGSTTKTALYDFAGRHLNQVGDDLLPLGGAYAKTCDAATGLWDGQGASDINEVTGTDSDGDGLPNWWEQYADENYRPASDEQIGWETIVTYGGRQMTAGDAYLRDLAKGAHLDVDGETVIADSNYEQTADIDSDGMPDWWEAFKSLHEGRVADPAVSHRNGDPDNDGLSNYAEYLAGEKLFNVPLEPTVARSDATTLDYFRTFGKLYVGEMLTDHDQMEDHWERSLGDEKIASATVWDATKDADEDGWDNFAENRYNGYAMSTLAQLVSHAMGDTEVLDAPTPFVKLTVRYNGSNLSAGSGQDGQKQAQGASEDAEASSALPNLVVRTYTDGEASKADAEFTMKPGTSVDKEVYLGGWEDRVVHGTMAPGNVDLGSVNLKFAQVPQSDRYSWTDENGLHLSGTYAEFKEALKKNPDIIQNIQDFEWLELTAPVNEYTSADRAVYVSGDGKTGYIAVYGERVGTIDLLTGDFTFDMAAMNKLRVNYTFSTSVNGAWSYKEAIFKLTYSAKIPSLQTNRMKVSLGKADTGFVKGGRNTIVAFFDNDSSGDYTPGEPFGVLNDVDIGWAGRDLEIELTDMSAITPRVELWGSSGGNGQQGGGQQAEGGGAADATASDRGVRVGTATFTDGSNRFEVASAPATVSRVHVVRYMVDKFPVYKVGVDAGVVLDKAFDQGARSYLHEGDFFADGKLDIDWDNLYDDVVDWRGTQAAGCEVTNVTYLIVYNWDADAYRSDADTTTVVKASSTLVTRRFEKTRTVPTACPERAVCNKAQPTFAWKIENEDMWASWFGTTYTGFKVRVKDAKSKKLVYDSGIRRLPAQDSAGVYSWTAPLYVDSVAPGTGVVFSNLTTYTWEVALYNAKFKADTIIEMEKTGNPFSTPETFRMNVTTADASSEKLAVRVCYAGPAKSLKGKVRVQAFESPDFTGDPLAELTIDGDNLGPDGSAANATLTGLASGEYFLRAYIDTNGNFVRDAWESWGYLSERDLADKTGIFNPVSLATAGSPATTGVRKLFIEDCDTDGDWFPDVWEAEQNGNVFVRTKIGPVTGNAELIGVNTNLAGRLDAFPALAALATANGFAMASGISPARIAMTTQANGATSFTVDNRVESVQIGTLAFDANGDVVISVEGSTTSTEAVGLSSFYSVASETTKTVTCRVYCKADLASEWGEPVAEKPVTVGAGTDTLTVDKTKVPASSAFFKVEVDE